MYLLKDKTIIIELGGHQISESTLKNMKKKLNKNDKELEHYIQSIADRAVELFIEQYEDQN